jgi:hypothetical protein
VFGLKFTHEFTRNWFLDADFRSEHRDSNLAAFRFDVKVFLIGLRLVL